MNQRVRFQVELFMSYFIIVLLAALVTVISLGSFKNSKSSVFMKIKKIQNISQHVQSLRNEYFKFMRIVELCINGKVKRAEKEFVNTEKVVSESFKYLNKVKNIDTKLMDDIRTVQVMLAENIEKLIKYYKKRQSSKKMMMTYDDQVRAMKNV